MKFFKFLALSLVVISNTYGKDNDNFSQYDSLRIKIEDAIAQEYHEQALERTRDHLIKNFGRLDISLGDIQRHVRGEKNFPASGLIDMIAPTYSVPTDGGRLRAVSGESYIMLIRYTKDGPEVETVIPYGNSSDPESPHYTDQMLMYLDKKLKVMSLDREEVWLMP